MQRFVSRLPCRLRKLLLYIVLFPSDAVFQGSYNRVTRAKVVKSYDEMVQERRRAGKRQEEQSACTRRYMI